MAILKIINNPVDSIESLENLCNYITEKSKSKSYENFIGGKNLEPENAFNEMVYTQELFDKSFGRRAYHFIVSFGNDEPIMPDDAYDIGYDIANTFFSDYQLIFNVHTTQDNIHLHFALNTVSIVDGRKFHFDFAIQNKIIFYVNSIINKN